MKTYPIHVIVMETVFIIEYRYMGIRRIHHVYRVTVNIHYEIQVKENNDPDDFI